jgi:hypothetical protein
MGFWSCVEVAQVIIRNNVLVIMKVEELGCQNQSLYCMMAQVLKGRSHHMQWMTYVVCAPFTRKGSPPPSKLKTCAIEVGCSFLVSFVCFVREKPKHQKGGRNAHMKIWSIMFIILEAHFQVMRPFSIHRWLANVSQMCCETLSIKVGFQLPQSNHNSF